MSMKVVDVTVRWNDKIKKVTLTIGSTPGKIDEKIVFLNWITTKKIANELNTIIQARGQENEK